jgi:hypothetical protein
VRWLVALVAVLGGCSFPHGVVLNHGDATTETDVAPEDAAIDSPDAEALCQVGVASTTGTDRGRVGGDGGSANFAPLACMNAGDRIVGIALKMSNQDTLYGARSAQGIRIACAPVAVRASGTATTGTITTYEIVGTGGFDWAPSTWTALTQCKPGWILSGLSAHTNDGDNLFLDVSITCAQVGPTGKLVATETIYVDGSLDEPDGADAAACDDGEIVVRMPNRSGAGLDSLNLWCTTPTCQ